MALPDFPLTRGEQYLNRTATGSGTIPEFPLTRVDQYLNKIATGSGDTPEQPLTRMEQYLDYIAENGGGGGSGGGAFVITKRRQGDPKASQGTKVSKKVVLDKTYNEIVAAIEAGRICVIYYYDSANDSHYVEYVWAYKTLIVGHVIGSLAMDSNHMYISDSADGVLVEQES